MFEFQPWESEYFDKKIYKIIDGGVTKNDIRKFLDKANFDLLQRKTDLSNCNEMNLLISNGFAIKGYSIALVKVLDATVNINGNVSISTQKDIAELVSIAKNVFQYSRFFSSFYDRKKANDFYAIWVEKSITGDLDDICFISKENDSITGFITLRYVSTSVCQIGLIAVDKNKQGKGIASMLLDYVSVYAKEKGIATLIIETQYENKIAISLYEKNGFTLDTIEAWLHLYSQS